MNGNSLRRVTASLALAWILLAGGPAPAQWAPGGVLVSNPGTVALSPQAVADLAGGALLVWNDWTAFPDVTIAAARLGADGTLAWPARTIVGGTGDRSDVRAVPDGAGGAVILWSESRAVPGVLAAMATRIDAAGGLVWPAPVPLCTDSASQAITGVLADGNGGAFVVWHDTRRGISGKPDLYAQRISASGVRAWPDTGVVVGAGPETEVPAEPVSDGEGGIYVAWEDARVPSDVDMYGQWIDAAGVAHWGSAGRLLLSVPGWQGRVDAISDGTDGFILEWEDARADSSGGIWDRRVYVQRITRFGKGDWQWRGVRAGTAEVLQRTAGLCADGSGGAIAMWIDDHRGSGYAELFAQHVDRFGGPTWAPDGALVAPNNDYYDDVYPSRPVPDGAGGAVVFWEDYRHWDGYADVYSQRIAADGTQLWDSAGVPVMRAWDDQYPGDPVRLSDGGLVVPVSDFREANTRLFAQRVDPLRGDWGHPEPRIAGVRDIPGDQGGKVLVSWNACRADAVGRRDVTHYSLWRALGPPGVAPAESPAPVGRRVVNAADIPRGFSGPAARLEKVSGRTWYWEWVGNLDARYAAGYSFAAPTLADSSAAGGARNYFEVIAHTADRWSFWVSGVDSGYSVDNLAPLAPQGVVLAYDANTVRSSLHWHAVDAADLSHYALYQGAGPGFVPSAQNRIATAADTVLSGLAYQPAPPNYLKISAVDIHGNESAFTVVPSDSTVTPVGVVSFGARWTGEAVEVYWTMQDAGAVSAWHVGRRDQGTGGYLPVGVEVVSGTDGTARFLDASAAAGRRVEYRVSAVEPAGEVLLFETSVRVPKAGLSFAGARPNPFGSHTELLFSLPDERDVDLSVFDAGGRRVARIVWGRRPAGRYRERFDASGLGTGVYFVRLRAGSSRMTRKVVVVR